MHKIVYYGMRHIVCIKIVYYDMRIIVSQWCMPIELLSCAVSFRRRLLFYKVDEDELCRHYIFPLASKSNMFPYAAIALPLLQRNLSQPGSPHAFS